VNLFVNSVPVLEGQQIDFFGHHLFHIFQMDIRRLDGGSRNVVDIVLAVRFSAHVWAERVDAAVVFDFVFAFEDCAPSYHSTGYHSLALSHNKLLVMVILFRRLEQR